MKPSLILGCLLLAAVSSVDVARAEHVSGARGLLDWVPGQNLGWLANNLKLPQVSTGFSVTVDNPITKETKSLSFALASGGAEAESVSLADEVKKNGVDSTAQTYAKALSDGRSAAVGLSFAKASKAGGEEAKAASKVLARTFGRGNPSAIASAMGKAYNQDGTAVAQSLSDAIVQANNGGQRRAVAESTAEALSKGGSEAKAFSRAYAEAVSNGKCDQVADSFAEAVAIAEDKGQGSNVARAIAESSADVADCVFKPCGPVAQNCCQWFSVNRGKCFCPPWQSWCNWNLLTAKPFPIWETEKRGWARDRYCKCK